VSDRLLHEAVCRQRPELWVKVGYMKVCRQIFEIWVRVGYIKLCVERQLNCGGQLVT